METKTERGNRDIMKFLKKLAKVSGIFLLAVFSVLFVLLIVLEIGNAKKIVHGVSFNGLDMGRMTKFEARLQLEKRIIDYNKESFTLVFGDKKWQVSPENLGVRFDMDKIVAAAFSVGRSSNPINGLKEQLRAFFVGQEIDNGEEVKTGVYVDEDALNKFIDTNLGELETPTQDRTIFYNKETKTFWVNPPSNGKIISRYSISKDALEYAMEDFSSGKIDLSLTLDQPKITEEKAKAALNLARNIAKRNYILTFDDKEYPLTNDDLLEIMEFSMEERNGDFELIPRFKKDELKTMITALAPSVNRQQKNAVLGADENNKIKEVAKSSPGIELDVEKTAEALQKNIISGFETPMVVNETTSTISKESLEQMGITDYLGKGESNFAGSPKNRISNIKVGAAKFNNIFIDKDAEFSFVTVLGPVDDTTGYKPELVIKKNKTVPEYGGGLCQVSTTAFRAAIYSGLKITERFPHAYPVQYYNPQGFDATIYPPHPDLRFINDTPEKILVQTKVEGTKLTFTFFGKRDGRETKVIGPVITQKKADGSLKAYLTQEVYRDNALLRTKTFWSSYQSHSLFPTIRNPLD
jgi:vancomycin resistance protein YoaR